MKKWLNLLPRNTEASELTASGVLLITVILGLFGVINPYGIFQSAYLWYLLALVPVVHIGTIVTNAYTKTRAFLCLITGGLMVYFGLVNVDTSNFINTVSTVVIGFSNLYAFLINHHKVK